MMCYAIISKAVRIDKISNIVSNSVVLHIFQHQWVFFASTFLMETLVQHLNSNYTLKHIAIVMIIYNLFAQIMVKKLLN